jgi:MinD-like ATPase involved in chromosome partitioning or flagellar assembly
VFAPFDEGGRLFHRLRNELLAGLPQQASRVIVVTGASRGPAGTLVAANLATAFARTGSETVLISAQLPGILGDAAPVTGLFGVAPTPGLSDVLAGRAELSDAAQRAPRTPRLRVMTPGGAASAVGLLQSQALRDMLRTLRQQAEYVVIEAPSTATSADAQSLAGLADTAILAVELRQTRYTQVVDAAEQLRRVGAPVLGAVLLPQLGRLEPAANGAASPGPLPQPMRDDPAGQNFGLNGGPNAGAGRQASSALEAPTMIFRLVEEDADEPVGAARQPTATGVLAAFTEDGPLDGAR